MEYVEICSCYRSLLMLHVTIPTWFPLPCGSYSRCRRFNESARSTLSNYFLMAIRLGIRATKECAKSMSWDDILILAHGFTGLFSNYKSGTKQNMGIFSCFHCFELLRRNSVDIQETGSVTKFSDILGLLYTNLVHWKHNKHNCILEPKRYWL